MLPSRLLTLTRRLLAAPPISTSDTTPSLPDVELDDLSPASATSQHSNFDDDFSFPSSYASSEASEPETTSRRSSISSFASSLFFSNSNSSAPSSPLPAAEPDTHPRQTIASGMSNTRYRQAHQQVCRKYW